MGVVSVDRGPCKEFFHSFVLKLAVLINRSTFINFWRQNKIHRQKEYFWTVGLNAANDIEYIELVTIGTSNRNIVTPVQVLSLAAAKQCQKIVLCHNHPSGNLEPSEADILFTERMEKAAAILEIELLDHIIITETNYVAI